MRHHLDERSPTASVDRDKVLTTHFVFVPHAGFKLHAKKAAEGRAWVDLKRLDRELEGEATTVEHTSNSQFETRLCFMSRYCIIAGSLLTK